VLEVIERSAFKDEIKPADRTNPKFNSGILALIGGFTPRRCGIATFTADVYASLSAAQPDLQIDVYAMTPAPFAIAFDAPVSATIIEGQRQSYLDAAQQIERSGAHVVWLQHEFGLFGGPAGDIVLELVERIAAPLIITLHTVLANPNPDQMHVMRRLIAHASKLVVMSERSRDLLGSVYGADSDQIILIPHGVPDRPFGRSEKFKAQLGFQECDVLLTFGLLSPGKGIEAVIAAMPAIIVEHPKLLYCIAGATHPNLLAAEGEKYRENLKTLASSLGIEQHVYWLDAFLETDFLLDLIEATDVYVTPYTGADQSTSGTLSYALALGKAVISTPYVHAVELLSDDHGIIVPFNDSRAIATEVIGLLSDRDRLSALQKRAYDRNRDMIWPAFAVRCLEVIKTVRVSKGTAPIPSAIGINGLLRICDETGILQHSISNVPDRAHGYCVDDNARALMLTNILDGTAAPIRQLATTFAAFVQSSWNDDRREFRNFMGFGRNWLEEVGSEDSCGRTLWALGSTVRLAPSAGLRHWAQGLFDRTVSSADAFGSPRAIAFVMLGADHVLEKDIRHKAALSALATGADHLLALFERSRRDGWEWFEDILAYDNARLSEAMIRAGMRLDRHDVLECGLATLRWINNLQTAPNGNFRPVGSSSFGRPYERPRPFDQQPVEIWATIDAASAAYDLTADARWLVQARQAYDWFSGANDRGVAVADPQSGTCHDGINPHGLNLNEGAESVLAYQHATIAIRGFMTKVR
jgi:glycosyltransferase involved in cell wall biosynthesis